MLGGAVVIAAGYIVIKEKGKLDTLEQTEAKLEQGTKQLETEQNRLPSEE